MIEIAPQLVLHRMVVGHHALSWRDVVRDTGVLLADCGLSDDTYGPAIERNIEVNGPYLVIAPGVALLHARPDEGALAPGLVIVTLAEAVPFGHSTNDPVWLVIGLTAVDDHGHLEALAALARVLAAPGALELLEAVRGDTDAFVSTLTSLSHPSRSHPSPAQGNAQIGASS